MLDIKQIIETAKTGENAKALRDNPLFATFLTCEKARIFGEFQRSKWWQRKARESLWHQSQAVGALENKLRSLISQGDMAEEELRKRKKNY